MSRLRTSPLWLSLLIPAVAVAQEGGRASVSPPPVQEAPPAPDVDPSRLPRLALTAAAAPALAEQLSDTPAREGEARYEITPTGDRLLSDAADDPLYLGFAGGSYRPPAGERLDPLLQTRASSLPADERPEHVVYAFAILSNRVTAERLAHLEDLGARVLGLHSPSVVKLAVPRELVEDVAADGEVHWLGLARRSQRVHPALAAELVRARPDRLVDVIVDLFESDLGPASTEVPFGSAQVFDGGSVAAVDAAPSALPRTLHSNGWQQYALEDLGVEVRSYSEGARAFRARAVPAVIDRLLDLDFVLGLELDAPKEAGHDNSTPMIDADAVRQYASGGTTFGVVTGMIDTGLDVAHSDLNHTWGVGWELGGTGGAWNDVCEHGSHVAGTILGNGATKPELRGVAPGLGWGGAGRFYNIKTSNACSGWSFDMQVAANLMHTSYFDGVNWTPPPHLVSNSWGNSGGPWFGSEYDSRIIDTEVFGGYGYVFLAGNNGPGASTLWLQSSAKNALTVGSVDSTWSTGINVPGIVSSFSSRGPTADGRWKPNVVAVGNPVLSVDANSGSGYVTKSGTSMATPHVTGVAAQVLDNMSWLRYVPERLNSILMATSLTKGNQVLTTPADAHLRDYGTGRVDAWRANYATPNNHWANWGAFLPANNYTWADFYVAPGCTRIVVCMNYVEPPASANATKALLSNFDLIIDQPPIDPNFNVGDWYAQQSSVDNTEIRILENPTPGTWRWKIWPSSAPTSVYYGLTVAVSYDDTTPTLGVYAAAAKTYLKPNEQTDVSVSVTNPSYTASGVVVEPTSWGFGQGTTWKRTKTLADGAVSTNTSSGKDLPVLYGDIAEGATRSATWRQSWGLEGVWGFVTNVRGDNASAPSTMAVVTVDGTAPSTVSNLKSTTHKVGQPTCATWTTMVWNAASDSLSGLAGYRVLWDHSAGTSVSSGSPNLASTATTYSTGLGATAQPWYFHIAAIDKSGNWGATATSGPYTIILGAANNYCVGAPNSVGSGAVMGHSGSLGVAANDFVLRCTGLPASKPGLFFYGSSQTQVPLGNGFRCVATPLYRFPVINSVGGVATWAVDFTNPPVGGAIHAGSTWNFQFWYRDPAAGGASFNLSNGRQVTFCD